MKMLVIQGRNSDLRFRWAQMQNNQPPNAHHPKGVVRYGPVHINPLHTSIMLEIIAHIVSDKVSERVSECSCEWAALRLTSRDAPTCPRAHPTRPGPTTRRRTAKTW